MGNEAQVCKARPIQDTALRHCALLYTLQLEQPADQTKFKKQLEVAMDESEFVLDTDDASFPRLTELCTENKVIVSDHGTDNT